MANLFIKSIGAHCAVCLVPQSNIILCGSLDCSLPDSSVHGDYLDKNTGVGFHALLQGTFPTQGSNPGLLHCRQILYCLSHQGSPLDITDTFIKDTNYQHGLRNSQAQMAAPLNSIQYLRKKERIPILYTLFSKTEKQSITFIYHF